MESCSKEEGVCRDEYIPNLHKTQYPLKKPSGKFRLPCITKSKWNLIEWRKEELLKSNSTDRIVKCNAYRAKTKRKAKDLHGSTKPEQSILYSKHGNGKKSMNKIFSKLDRSKGFK